MKITVIISTFNRYESLYGLLETFCRQERDQKLDYEIIIVDNNSKDRTREIVDSFAGQNSRIKYVFEPRQGLSNARNTGLAHAQGEIIAFIDDDVSIGNTWVADVAASASESDFDAMGGRVLPCYPPQTPAWVKAHKQELCGPIVCHDYGKTVKPYGPDMLPFIGANMVFKKKIFEELGLFNPQLGAGQGTIGEDTEYFHRLKNAGKKIIYNPRILAIHPVDKDRMRLKYIAQWNIAAGKYAVIRDEACRQDKGLPCLFGAPRYLFRQLLARLLPLARSMGHNPHFIIEWGNFFWQLGKIQAYRSMAMARKR